MALEVKLGQDLRLRQQLVMTPQLQQAIKILQLSLPELEAIVQSELEQNPMLEPLDQSPAEAASESGESDSDAPQGDGEPLPPESDGASANSDDDWETGSREEKPASSVEVEARDAALEIKELNNLEKLDWREYLETYSNNWQESAPADNDDDHRSALENTPLKRSTLEDHLMFQLPKSSACWRACSSSIRPASPRAICANACWRSYRTSGWKNRWPRESSPITW